MKSVQLACVMLLALTPAVTARPGPAPAPNPLAAYVILTGPGFELRVTNEDGSNASVLYKSKLALRFDLAPRAQRQIAFSEGNSLKLLTYLQTATGTFATSEVQTLFTDTSRIANLDISPDGTKIAFATDVNKDLRVIDIASRTSEVWTTVPFVWDIAWYKNGAAIAFIATNDTNSNPQNLYEISAPGAAPVHLYTDRWLDLVDASRANPDALLLSYNDASGDAYVGLWANGSFLQPSLAARTPAYKGALNCNDTKLMFGAPDKNGQTIWYSRDLTTNQDTLYTKVPRANWAQFWPTC